MSESLCSRIEEYDGHRDRYELERDRDRYMDGRHSYRDRFEGRETSMTSIQWRGESGAMIGTDTQEMGMELWDRYVMREEPIEADQVPMTVLAELEAALLHMNVATD
ncbi:hypothetical protein F2Q69_00013352 [Brassica cretica]|uniref:Uncharacterized protein n=1 Tax=Brassica cretica TaxID=69181 RepID=A0A8S9R4X6_BRACR|nr:hypothetical protein F2Q69_00013352 [Brassica cretica]